MRLDKIKSLLTPPLAQTWAQLQPVQRIKTLRSLRRPTRRQAWLAVAASPLRSCSMCSC